MLQSPRRAAAEGQGKEEHVADALTRDQIEQFRQDGYLGPFALCSPDEMARIAAQLDSDLFASEPPQHGLYQSRHLDSRQVYDLCAHPAIISRMASIYGPDLLLWRSHFFLKEQGAAEVPWHQDTNYRPLEPPLNISAWVAIDDATVENACVHVIPGSHQTVVPHVRSPEGMLFPEMADMEYVDTTTAVAMELRAGEFFLFNERTVHQSAPNSSDRRRLGLAVRVTTPVVRVDHRRLFPGHKVVVVSGEDRLGFSDVADPPE
jgi:ectoine hydroxylase-related dioxygenase (phytanoyl-CoA dioxygenase family)